jgi:hypothetical protein
MKKMLLQMTSGFLQLESTLKQKFQIAHARNQSELTNFATKLEVYKLFRNVQSRRTNYNYKYCECVHANALVILLVLIESTNFTY